MAPELLLYGFGNPGRLDDGIGPAFISALEQRNFPAAELEVNYQLSVEDALTLSHFPRVIFVDASLNGEEPFAFKALQPAPQGISFSSHSLTPQEALAAAEDLFGTKPRAWLLSIRGYEFGEFGERLSEGAKANLEHALAALGDLIARTE